MNVLRHEQPPEGAPGLTGMLVPDETVITEASAPVTAASERPRGALDDALGFWPMGAGESVFPRLRSGDLHFGHGRISIGSPTRSGSVRGIAHGGYLSPVDAGRDGVSHASELEMVHHISAPDGGRRALIHECNSPS